MPIGCGFFCGNEYLHCSAVHASLSVIFCCRPRIFWVIRPCLQVLIISVQIKGVFLCNWGKPARYTQIF